MGKRIALVALVLVSVLVGGWFYKKQHPALLETADVAQSEPFDFVGCQARLLDESPALAISFTQPVDRGQNFDKLITVSDVGASQTDESGQPVKVEDGTPKKILQGSWTVGTNPRTIYFPYILPERAYQIEIKTDLRAKDGSRLPDIHTCDVASEAMVPSFFFASKGVVLPAKQNGGLPIVTVNTPEVDIQFLKVEASQLPAFLARAAGNRPKAKKHADEESVDQTEDSGEGEGGYDDYYNNRNLKGQISGYELDNLREMARSVYLGRFNTDDKKNRRHVTFIPVEDIKELQEPGVYVAVMNQPGKFAADYQVSYFYVSDIGLHARRFANQIDAFATSLKSGKALGGIDFELLDDNAKVLSRAKSDGEGHAIFAGANDNVSVITARHGNELSVIAVQDPSLDLSEFDIGGYLPSNNKLFVYSGRDLYRPGEKFDISVIARDADGKPFAASATPNALPLTAVIKRPDGRTVQTVLLKPSGNMTGYYQHTLALPADAQTGSWAMEVRVDPAARQPDSVWKFSVEEFLPERMKMDLQASAESLKGYEGLTIAVKGDYLFGAPAAGNRLLGSVFSERDRNPVAKIWPGFIFGDVADDNQRNRQDLDEAALDDDGKAEVTVPVAFDGRHSPMKIRTSFSLLESGGRPVVRSIERSWWPAPQLIGVRPLFDSDTSRENSLAEFELIRVDTQGKLAPLNGAQLRLFNEDRRYYWRYDDQHGWHSGYTDADELIESRILKLDNRVKVALPVKYGRYRLDVTDPATSQTTRYRFYAGWGSRDAEDVGNRPDRVQLKLEHAPYKAGDRARLTITPPHDGEALITVEGDKVLYTKRTDVKTSGSTVDIYVDEKWNRHDLYISVAVFRPGSAGDRVTPARALGLVHLPLARDDRKLKVALSAPAKVEPEKRTTVKIKVDGLGNDKNSAYVTLSAVDVGILNITRFATPDPLDFFFGKHRYGADVMDIYGKLIEKMDGTRGKLKWGGDAGMRDSKSMPKKVKLVDLFSGPVTLNANGEAEIPLDIPDFNGTLRLMAVAQTADHFGNAEAEMVVAAPIVAELNLPRFISPGDQATIALDITNLSGAAQDIRIDLSASGLAKIAEGSKTVSLKDKQRSILHFGIEATDAYGLAPLKLVISAGKINIQREAWLQVQPITPPERDIKRVRIEPNGSFKLDPALLERFYAGSANASISLSNKPPLNVRSIVKGLLDYPYGCLEQTTSAAYPHVFIDEAGAKAVGLEPRTWEQRASFIEGAINRIAGYQQPRGGFTLWGNSGNVSTYEIWMTAYVMGFLMDAKDAGFNVPDSITKRAGEAMLTQLQQAPNQFGTLPATLKIDSNGNYDYRDYELIRNQHQRFAESAHIAYMLARQQQAPLSTLRTLFDTYRDRAKSPLPLIHLGIALQLMGDEARAKTAIDEAMNKPYGINRNNYYWGEWLGDYGSQVRDLSLSYALLVKHKINHPKREVMLFNVAEVMGNRGYYSTQERLALFLAARAAGGDIKGGEWTATINSKDKVDGMSSKGTELRSLTAEAVKQGVEIHSKHGEPLFVEVDMQGYPSKAPAPRNDIINVGRDWFETSGDAYAGRSLKVGDMLIVRVRAESKQTINDGMIVDRIPAGFEVENLNISQGPQSSEFVIGGVNVASALSDARIKHVEYRDDRYVVAATLGQRLDVFYQVRVVTPGKFVVPPTYAEDMYRPEIRGIGAGNTTIVITDRNAKNVSKPADKAADKSVEKAVDKAAEKAADKVETKAEAKVQ